MQGASDRLEVEHKERAWLAWHIEALARCKKLPALSELTDGNKPKADTMTELRKLAARLPKASS